LISQNTIQQILSRVDITEVVGTFIKLKKRGANYLGICPFHNEKSPSFTVSPAKEIYKCFGCGKTGNSIGFLMEAEKYSYVEALRWLAAKYNVEIEETAVSAEVKEAQLVAESLHIINSYAQKFFTEQLLHTTEGQNIGGSYLEQRGFSNDIIAKFNIGYNPEARNTFATKAIEDKYSKDLLLKTGLITERDGQLYDNYRGRIIFPIHSQSGKTIGFGARIIKKNDKAPKYINTPENEVYVKSKILYGTYQARTAIDKADECLLVEGYTDVVSLHQAGIENVVASGGTALTPDQLRLIKKYTNNLTIIYDGDGAGIKAALRGLDLALEAGLNVQLVLIPDGEDPDSYVHKVGKENFNQFVASNKKDVVLFQLNLALKDAGNDINKRKLVINQIAETIAKVNKLEDFNKQQHYIRQTADILKIEEQGLLELVNKHIRDKVTKDEQKITNKQNLPDAPDVEGYVDDPAAPTETDIDLLLQKDELQERALVRSLIEHGSKPFNGYQSVAHYIMEEFAQNDFFNSFDNPTLIEIVTEYNQLLQSGATITTNTFLYHANQAISSLTASLITFNYDLSERWNQDEDEIPKNIKDALAPPIKEETYPTEVIQNLCYVKLKKLKRLLAENQAEMQNAKTDAEVNEILAVHVTLKRMEMDISKVLGTVILK
jgi:DNA primase